MVLVDNSLWPCIILLMTGLVRDSVSQKPPKIPPTPPPSIPEPYYVLNNDKSYQFGYQAKDHYHHGDGSRNNIVKGEWGARSPATGVVDSVLYTAGPRGFRPQGKNIARKYDLTQGPRPANEREDPSYNFGFRTRTYNREEGANRLGEVTGRYSFVDDIGERHNVEYVAGKNTGFHVRTPFPDSNPSSIGPLFYKGPGKPGEKAPRGRTSIQRGLDGSYKFVSAGPDHRRTESSDAKGHVRGSYTFLDDKGVTHTVHYIAGPETGYRVLKNVKAPHFPSWYPLEPSRPSRPPSYPPGARPTDFGEDYGDGDKNIEDIFGGPQEQLSTAASGHAKPSKPPIFGASEEKDEEKPPAFDNDFGGSFDEAVGGRPTSTARPPFGGGGRPFNGGGPQGPSFLDEEGLQGGFLPTSTRRPFGQKPSKPSFLGEEGEEEDGFGPKPGGTRPPFGGGGGEDGGFGATGIGGGERPSAPPSDHDFMDDLFKPSGPTGPTGGEIGKPSGGRPVGPTGGFGGFDSGRPSATRPPVFPEDGLKPFGEGVGGPADEFELFGDKGKPGTGRPSYMGGSKEDMNYGFFDDHKGPTARPPSRPSLGGGKDEGAFDFFGGTGGTGAGAEKGPSSSTARPGGTFDFFGEDKGPRPTKLPPGGAGGGGKDDFDFFGNDKTTQRPFRPTPSGTKPDDHYSFDGSEPPSRPPFPTADREEGTITGSINVATSYDGVAVRAHVQSIDFLPYGSRVPSPSEQFKQQLKSEATNNIQHHKRDTIKLKQNDND